MSDGAAVRAVAPRSRRVDQAFPSGFLFPEGVKWGRPGAEERHIDASAHCCWRSGCLPTNGLMNFNDADDLLAGIVRLSALSTAQIGSGDVDRARTSLTSGTARPLYSLKRSEELIRRFEQSGELGTGTVLWSSSSNLRMTCSGAGRRRFFAIPLLRCLRVAQRLNHHQNPTLGAFLIFLDEGQITGVGLFSSHTVQVVRDNT